MKVAVAFLKKYYGSLIGGMVGFILIAVYYYLTEYHRTPDTAYLLHIVEFLTPSLDTITTIMIGLLGAAAFFLWFLLIIAVYLLLFLHIITTVFMYGLIGLLIHAGVRRLQGKDKNGITVDS